MRRLTHAEWKSEGERRFGADAMAWKFVCPVCKHVATPADWKAAGAGESAVAFSCVGRWLERSRNAFEEEGRGPCNYAGGGLFRLNPVIVDFNGNEHAVFEFAEAAP